MAFAGLVELYWDRLYRWLYHLTHQRHDAEDIAQETFLKAYCAMPSFQGGTSFQAWLFRIAWTTHAKTLRRPRLAVPLEPERAASEPDHEPSPEASAERSQRVALLRRAVATLPPDLRYPIVAHYWAELPVSEIAVSERITPMAVRKRLARAFRLLAMALEEKTR